MTNDSFGIPTGPLTATPPLKPEFARPVADPRTEYVSAGGYAWLANYLRALPAYIDDVTADLGDDLYERMLKDPTVAAALRTLKGAILQDGVTLTPALADDRPGRQDPEWDLAREIADFCRRSLDRLARPLDDVLCELLDGLAFGFKVAEQIYRIPEDGPDAGRLVLAALKVKPRRSTAFVVDVFGNVVGLLGLIPGQGAPVLVGSIVADAKGLGNLLPRAKFAIFSFLPRDGDPRGTSVLRPAYNAWWIKQQLWPEYLKYLTQFAGPSLIGYTPEAAQSYRPTDADGNPSGAADVTPEQVMNGVLVGLRNGTAATFPFGSKVEPLAPSADGGAAFLSAFDLLNREMTHAILQQTRATLEAEHGSKADSQTAQDVLGLLVRMGKRALAAMLESDVLDPLVRYNFGGDAADRLTPTVELGAAEHQDRPALLAAVAELARSGYLAPAQFPRLDAALGLPPRGEERESIIRKDRSSQP